MCAYINSPLSLKQNSHATIHGTKDHFKFIWYVITFCEFFFNAGNNDGMQCTLVEGAPLTPQ